MRHINWWNVGGAVVTFTLAVTMSVVWDLTAVSAVVVGYGAVIGTDIRQSRMNPTDRTRSLLVSALVAL